VSHIEVFSPAFGGIRFASGKAEIFFAPKRAKKEKFAGLIKKETEYEEGWAQ
jgi:hypothetical protein